MMFVCLNVKGLQMRPIVLCIILHGRRTMFLFFQLATLACFNLATKFLSPESGTGLPFESTKFFPNANGQLVEYFQRMVSVHSKFCHAVPMRTYEEKTQDGCVVRFRKKTFKDWYSTLASAISILQHFHRITQTCKISSKSRAASFLSSDTLFENRLMVSRPKVGTLLNL